MSFRRNVCFLFTNLNCTKARPDCCAPTACHSILPPGCTVANHIAVSHLFILCIESSGQERQTKTALLCLVYSEVCSQNNAVSRIILHPNLYGCVCVSSKGRHIPCTTPQANTPDRLFLTNCLATVTHTKLMVTAKGPGAVR